jgi:MFS transporter, putative metabolite transport protein
MSTVPSLDAWRWMYGAAIIPALAVTVGRFFITESPSWLHIRGAVDRAEAAARRLLVRTPQSPTSVALSREPDMIASGHGGKQSFFALFAQRNLRATILASVPWFLQDCHRIRGS